MKNILLYMCQLPQNIAGLITIAFIGASKVENNKYKDAAIWFTKYNIGVSLGRYIIINNRYKGNNRYIDYNQNTIKHEYGHCIQSKILGPLYLIIIGIPSGIHNILDRKGKTKNDYYDYWCEKWADKLGGVVRVKSNTK